MTPGAAVPPVPAPIAAELLGLVDAAAAAGVRPRIRAVHLPFGMRAGSRDAEFCAIELDDGAVGFAFALLGDTLPELANAMPGLQLAGAGAAEIARWYAEAGAARRALGLAAINAITRSVYRRSAYQPDTAADSVGLVDPQAHDHIGMIGLFVPLVDRILATGATLTVLELRSELAQRSGRLRVTIDPAELGACNKVLATSTILLNDTLDSVLGACSATGYFGVIGPSAGCMPDPLFARGVDTLGGLDVVDLARFRDAFQAGTPWGRHCRKTCIRRADYPGFAAVLARVR